MRFPETYGDKIEVMKLLSHLSILSSQKYIVVVHQLFKTVPDKQTKRFNLLGNRGAAHSQKLPD